MPLCPLRLAALVLWPFASALVGCASEDRITEADFPASYAAALCDKYAECSCSPSMDLDACRADEEADVMTTRVAPASSGLRYDPYCGTRSVHAIADFGCETLDEVIAAARGDDDCDPCKLYVGDRRVGESCTVHGPADDCVRGAACVDGSCVDVCAPVPLGEPCLQRRCEPDLICEVDLDTEGNIVRSACVREAALGEPCIDDATCSQQLTCDLETEVCRMLPFVGEPCTFSCAEGWCEQTGTGATCRAAQANGEACTFDEQCEGDCDLALGVCISAQALACGWVG